MTRKEVAVRLRMAAGLMQRVGLARGRRRDFDGSVCALGALDAVMAGESWADYQTVAHAVVDRLDLRVGNHQDPYNQMPLVGRPDPYIARWSNLSSGKEEVAGGFLKVAEMLDAEEPPVVEIRKPVEVRDEELVEV